jgi:hypothetical protein
VSAADLLIVEHCFRCQARYETSFFSSEIFCPKCGGNTTPARSESNTAPGPRPLAEQMREYVASRWGRCQ